MAFDIPMIQARIVIIEKNLSQLAQIPHSDFETFKADFRTCIADAWRIVQRGKKDP